MDNLGFQHDVEEPSCTLSENSNNENIQHAFRSSHLISSNSDYRTESANRSQSATLSTEKTEKHESHDANTNTGCKKLSSCSFNLPKNKTLNKYRRFSGPFLATSRGPQCVEKVLNVARSESAKSDNNKCSSFIINDNNVCNNNYVPDSSSSSSILNKRREFPSEDGGYVDIHCISSNPRRSGELQPNNMRICSQQNNFQGNFSTSLTNIVQECSNHTPVPSLPLNNSYHEGYLSTMPSFSKTITLSPTFSNKNNLICDTSLDIHNSITQSPTILKSTNKYCNLSPSQSISNAQCFESSPSLLKKKQFSADADLNSLPALIKPQNNVYSVLNRATTLPLTTIKNARNENQSSPAEVPTVSGSVPMYYSGFLNLQQSSPRPYAENRQNMRRSSKILRESHNSSGGPGDREATLKKRAILRGWKLQFIPSNHSKRKTVAFCVLLFACVLVLVATGLVIYMTTAVKSRSMRLNGGVADYEESGVNVIAGEFRITNEKYEPSLKDETSVDFKQLADQICQQLDILFSASTLSSHYNHSHVTQFGHGLEKSGSSAVANNGILVKCKLVLMSAPPNGEAANQAGLEFLRGLQHHHGQMWLGNFIIDIQSIGFVGEVDKMPVPEMIPNPSILPGWSSWSSWTDCNSTSSLTINTQMRTRSCHLNRGTGAELSSIEPCLLLENAGGDLEVRDCENRETLNISAVTVLSSRVFEEGEIVSNDINVESTVHPTTLSSASNIELTEENTVTLQTIVLKRTTEYVQSMDDNATLRNNSRNNPAIPVMDLSLSTYRLCDECISGEVCVALSGEDVPTCRHPHDPNDPTGCGGLCLINVELCHKLDVDAFRCLDDSYCLPTEWRCLNQLCIPQVKRCDGHMNCYDHTDEYDCSCNLTTHFHCSNNTSCLPLKKKCDGIIDCWDGSDELNCTTACPEAHQFTCNNGQCILHARFCDGYADCEDKSDEPFGCGGECNNHEWKCGNGRCIKKQAVCNGNQDCGDMTDEVNCPRSRRRMSITLH